MGYGTMSDKLRHWPKQPKVKFTPGLLLSQLDKSRLRLATKVIVIVAKPVGIQYHAFEIGNHHGSLHSIQKAKHAKGNNDPFEPVEGAL
jgi:hypothetical protein